MTYLNLGILAHVDAGKTSLTERLLFHSGVIDRVGSVDSGDTQTDSMDLERRRGITIRAAVVSFPLGDRTVNLIDTPGHSDFIGEVERVLRVLDGAVLVVSAVEGVQAQTRVLLRTLDRLGIPVLIFVNKIDRVGAEGDAMVRRIRAELTDRVVALSTVINLGTGDARPVPRRILDEEALELLTDHSDDLLKRYVDGGLDDSTGMAELTRQARAGLLHPVCFGSAATGAGIPELATAIDRFLPSAPDDGGPATGTVFKVDRDSAGRKVAYLRMRSGSIQPRSHITLHRDTAEGRVEFTAKPSSVAVFRRGGTPVPGNASCGAIATVGGLRDVAIGDRLGDAPQATDVLFTRPTLETVVTAVDPAQRMALFPALCDLADRDPLVAPHRDPESTDISVKLYGEVQKEVIASLLATEFGIEVGFERTRTIHIERPIAEAHAVEEMGQWAGTHYLATIGLALEPAGPGTGVAYRMGVERGSLPAAFHSVIEETVRGRLQKGPFGWEVTDCRITLTHSGFDNALSNGGDFRGLTSVLVRRLLEQSGTRVYEPLHEFVLTFPESHTAAVLPALSAAGASITGHAVTGSRSRLTGTLPASAIHGFEQRLPVLASGDAEFTSHPGDYRLVAGPPPRRVRRR
ncbi:ribosomal protection tetracycline resistance protein [Stackebrandtia endophytica]|uniref:Ribosomal protection tetracycline resistance protein n=1 Tax=Stackebrandtia endophytica TaxID=1496996 RepID=A0A543B457_9ACTN|nr:TetM/TetW/TetO/TetS family tetracycline resistance ribosomal protection protein [Stackebrandtia endophytica]TQL79618.1 ribosomal protection tetracycline resistance protein [Stackebrandtia endophytica]